MAKPAYLSVKNYEKFQHYKDRNPPWIKLYNSILDDYAFTSLPEKSRYHYLAILLVASRLGNQIPYETSYLCNMLHVEEADLTPLINAGFLLADRKHKASIKLAPCKQSAMPEESRGETEESREEPKPAPILKLKRLESELPVDWKFNDRHQVIAEGFGLNVFAESAKFKDHHQARGTKFKDWDAAFRTWLNKAVEFKEAKR